MSTRSLNRVMLIGNLTRDVELRYTPSGTAVATFGMATNRGWTTDAGDRNEDTQFHRVVAWSKLAEICDQLLFKGRKVFIEGRLQTRKWTGQDGQQRETTEIVAENMMILDSKMREGGQAPAGEGDYAGGSDDQAAGAVAGGQGDDDVIVSDEPVVAEKAPAKTEKPEEKKSVKSAKSKVEAESKEAMDEVNVEDIPF